jgi:hypothetical protein
LDSNYLYNEKLVHSGEKTCLIINYLSRNYNDISGNAIRPLCVIKIFDYVSKVPVDGKRVKPYSVSLFIKEKINTILSNSFSAKIDDLDIINKSLAIYLFDSLIINNGESFELIQGAVIIMEFFNVYPFRQITPLQTNQYILNVKAIRAKIYNWTKDSIPIPQVDVMIGGKIFLLKQSGNDFVFFRHSFDCSDCPMTFYNEYVYRKEYGVIAFRSKYLFYNTNEFVMEKIGESNEYCYFK